MDFKPMPSKVERSPRGEFRPSADFSIRDIPVLSNKSGHNELKSRFCVTCFDS
jgi:hypothetical protein